MWNIKKRHSIKLLNIFQFQTGLIQFSAMPWFGIDIGGTLTKLVYFETKDESHLELEKENEVSQKLRNYLTKQQTYGKSGHRDIHLQV